MSALRIGRIGLRVAGMLVLAIGVGHVFMPVRGCSTDATLGMSQAARDHFYFLGTYAICSFLVAFGVPAIVHSKHAAVGTFSSQLKARVIAR